MATAPQPVTAHAITPLQASSTILYSPNSAHSQEPPSDMARFTGIELLALVCSSLALPVLAAAAAGVAEPRATFKLENQATW